MDIKSIDFVKYKKLSQDSDAFFFSEKFTPYLEIKLASNFSSKKLDYENYTAGNTDNPDDYSLPDIDDVILPERLYRINPFNKNNKIKLKTYNYSDSEYLKEINDFEDKNDNELLASDASKFMEFFKNKKIPEQKKQNVSLSLTNDNFQEQIFVIGERYFSENLNKNITENIIINQENKKNLDYSENFKTKETIEKNNTNNIFQYSSNSSTTRIQNSYENFEYDVNNMSTSYFNDFTVNNNTTKIINEVKNEIINNVNETVNKLESKILNQTVTSNEMKNIQNNIVQVIENKISEKENSILEKIEQKSKKDLNNFRNNLLNS